MQAESKFTDFPLSFIANPFTGDISLLKDEEAVKNSVKNLILTSFYERPFYSSKGCGIYQVLFELINIGAANQIEEHIKTVLYNWEPRVEVEEVIVRPNYNQDGYDVTIRYEIINQTSLVDVSFFLQRIK
jgi:phage baseplate assembly protein W